MLARLRSHLKHPPSSFQNKLALLAFFWMLLQLCSPGSLQMLPAETNWQTLLTSPLSGLYYIHVASILPPLAFFGILGTVFSGDITLGEIASFTVIYLFNPLAVWLWLGMFWSWLLKAISALIQSSFNIGSLLKQWRNPRWWIVPSLALCLCGLWATKLPVKAAFALSQPALEKVADATLANGAQTDQGLPQAGIYSVLGTYRLADNYFQVDPAYPAEPTAEFEKMVSIEILGVWAHQGFVRDLSRKSGGFEPDTFSLATNSNNHDQELFYLWDGWYIFQNYLD
ncbi:MAG: hypothetical protein AB8B99_07440 [Phormidesmis sp.]